MWTQDVLTHEYKVTRKINTKKKKYKLNESNLNRKKTIIKIITSILQYKYL